MKHLSLHPTLHTCSADTILRAIEELTFKSITYKSASGKSYDFNTADKMNCLLVNALLATGQLKSGQEYDFGLRATSRIKTFVFKFISVPAKWIKTSRRHVLNIYSDDNAYANLFKTDFG